jgi:hypothetical protein
VDEALPVALEGTRVWNGQLHVPTVVPELAVPTLMQAGPYDYEAKLLGHHGLTGASRLGPSGQAWSSPGMTETAADGSGLCHSGSTTDRRAASRRHHPNYMLRARPG